jgi:hypothetical protein
MKSFNSILGRASIVLATGGLLCLPASSPADPITLSVNSSLSSLTLVSPSSIAGLAYTPQTAGALTAFWGGSIVADVTLGVFTFSGGSTLTALANPNGPFLPGIQPGITGGVENYGVFAQGNVALLGGFTTVNGAYRDLTLDITAGTAENADTTFGMVLAFVGPSKLEYFITSPGLTGPGVVNPLNTSAGNTSLLNVTWDGTTLTLPVTFTTTGGNGRTERWQGTIVASVVPEPSSVALGLLGLGLFIVRRARTSPSPFQKS